MVAWVFLLKGLKNEKSLFKKFDNRMYKTVELVERLMDTHIWKDI